jgi:CubicO group peptidase (beta-lactamase class C family)
MHRLPVTVGAAVTRLRLPTGWGRAGIGLLLAALASIPLARAGDPGGDASPPRDAAHASFWWRWDNLPANPQDPPYSWYRPLVPLHGTRQPWLPAATDAQQVFREGALEDAAQFVESTAGQALIVLHAGRVELERYFAGTDASTPFSSHSMGRTLEALAIGIAVGQGKIRSIDDPASRYLVEWRDPAREAITIRQLLTMSGGFRTPPSREPGSAYSQSYYGSDITRLALDAKPQVAPGSAYAYDNFNNLALAVVLERATGLGYRTFLERYLWKPIGAMDAEILLDRPGGGAYPFCCIWSRPRDWARIGQLLVDHGVWRGRQIVPRAWVDAMQQPSPTNPNFGLQVFLGSAWTNPLVNRRASSDTTRPALTEDLFYASGAGNLTLMILPGRDLVILRVGHGSPLWRDDVLPNLLLDPSPSPRKPT